MSKLSIFMLRQYRCFLPLDAVEIYDIADELRFSDSSLRYWQDESTGEGYMEATDRKIHKIFRAASFCDGYFYNHALAVGERMTGLTVQRCALKATMKKLLHRQACLTTVSFGSQSTMPNYTGTSVYKVCYKDGIGIVKYIAVNSGHADTRLLSRYHISGGSGLPPIRS